MVGATMVKAEISVRMMMMTMMVFFLGHAVANVGRNVVCARESAQTMSARIFVLTGVAAG